ncbi:hypothetical protein Poli38472_001801 [Pythium oligandrum]|uniref:Cytochrome P450 n=1 Tax=Pythium oligandrum TaxID=41045 RepID=A0A8K1FMR1_PYTOL|nr:hypothetical protein Poli38472_001801 [Pythium oligandrum]|eukprot:TMW69645.1 hypothetical protein Poli38472_001801 [Pythium oligandrum]
MGSLLSTLPSTYELIIASVCLFVTLGLSVPLRALQRKLRIAQGLAPIPGSKGTFLLGNMPELMRHQHRIYDYLEESLKACGGRMKTPWHLFYDGSLYITDPVDVEHVLATNFNNYIKPQGFIDAFREVFEHSFFALSHAHTPDNGAKWRLQRKVASKVFTTTNFKYFTEQVFTKYARAIAERLESEGSCDMQEVSAEYTLTSIFDIAFGTELSRFMDPERFAARMNFVNEHCASRIFIKQYYKWFRWVMPSEYRVQQYTAEIRAIADQILLERLTEPAEKLKARSDILSLFIKKARELDDESAELLSPETLRAIILTFLFAGRDTTAECITYMFYALARHPETQQKILDELEAASASMPGQGTETLSYDLVKQLKYLDAVAYETVRLYPSLPYNVRHAVHDDHLPDGTFVPAGVDVVYSPWYMGRNEAFWGKDALDFRPERWLERKTRPTAFEFPAFHGGPRVCLGMNMALLEAKIFTLVLLRNFHVQITDGEPKERGYVLKSGLFMDGGLPLTLRPRARAHT